MTAPHEWSAVRVERRGARLFVTLDDPASRNALSEAMLTDLEAVLAMTRDDASLRVLVLQGCDGLFCAGGNLKGAIGSAAPPPGQPDPVREENLRGGRLFHALNSHPLPVVALVDGPAMGGGFGLACCADVVITTDRARFALSETRLGLAPAQIAPYVLARVGLAKARMLALTGALIEGAQAQAIGLSDFHFPTAGEAQARLDDLLADIGARGPVANARTKAFLLDMAGMGGEAGLEAAADLFVTCLRGDEAQEGIAAFLEKRRPAWAEDI